MLPPVQFKKKYLKSCEIYQKSFGTNPPRKARWGTFSIRNGLLVHKCVHGDFIIIITIIVQSLYQLIFITKKDFIQPGQTQQISEAYLQKPKIKRISTQLFLTLTLDTQDINVFVGVTFINNNNKKPSELSNVGKQS